jgi:hypothetical protein
MAINLTNPFWVSSLFPVNGVHVHHVDQTRKEGFLFSLLDHAFQCNQRIEGGDRKNNYCVEILRF